MLCSLLWIVCTLLVHSEVNAQNMTCDADTQQPTVTRVSPPSGTTGLGGGVSSTFTIQGERLDRISRLEIELPSPLDLLNGRAVQNPMILPQRNSTFIAFQIPPTVVLRARGGSLVSLGIYPMNAACRNISLPISIHDSG